MDVSKFYEIVNPVSPSHFISDKLERTRAVMEAHLSPSRLCRTVVKWSVS